jgi:hypothetical protein
MYICGSRIGGNRRWKQDKALTLTSLRCSPYHKFQTQFLFIGKQLKTLTSSSTMNSIKYACSLNNQGVDLLVSGESAKAIKAFQCALFLLEKVANEAETSACTGMNLSSEVATQPFCGSTSTVQGLHDMHCYIYDHGIIITDTSNGESDEMLSLYGAIVLFNWALTSHREGRAATHQMHNSSGCVHHHSDPSRYEQQSADPLRPVRICSICRLHEKHLDDHGQRPGFSPHSLS